MPMNRVAAYTNSVLVVVRPYDEARDTAAVEELERRCEMGQPGKPSLLTDLMGDPLARIRHFGAHIMLVADYEGEIVGIIRGCIKTFRKWKKGRSEGAAVSMKLGYILGLRVPTSHRRMGIATKLVKEIEAWSKSQGAQYAYMATDCNNLASLNLFTRKCNYSKFLDPTVLIQPVGRKRIPLPPGIDIVRLNPKLAASLYRTLLTGSEFFPEDIDNLLNNKLNLGTFMAFPRNCTWKQNKTLYLPASFAMLSIWNTKQVFQLQLKGVSMVKRLACLGSRIADSMAPWLRIPSIPNVFAKFGFHFLYGLHMEGEDGGSMMKALCYFAHNKATAHDGCRAVVTEIGPADDALKAAVPHRSKYSCKDVWCIKQLGEEEEINDQECLIFDPTAPTFVDPRDV